jgi:hypothetical protein
MFIAGMVPLFGRAGVPSVAGGIRMVMGWAGPPLALGIVIEPSSIVMGAGAALACPPGWLFALRVCLPDFFADTLPPACLAGSGLCAGIDMPGIGI